MLVKGAKGNKIYEPSDDYSVLIWIISILALLFIYAIGTTRNNY